MPLSLCADQIETSTPPPPGISTFEDWIVQIPDPSGQNGVQMPYSIVGFCLTNAPPKEQSSSVPVVCNKACVHSRYTETSIQDGKLFRRWLRGTRYALKLVIQIN